MAAKRDISTEGLGETDRGAAGVRRGARRRPSARGRGVAWSAAPSATRCSDAGWTNLDLVVDGEPAQLIADARRRGPWSTSASRPRRSSSPGGAVDVARGADRDLPAPRRAARGRAGELRRRPRRAATSPSTRSRCRSTRPGELIDPHDGLDDLRRRPAAGPARRARSSTTRPGPCAPPATRRGSGSSSSRGRWSCSGRPTSSTVSAERVAAELGRLAAEPAARRGFELLAEWGLLDARRRAAAELIDASRRPARASRRGRARRRARRPCSPPSAGPTPEVAELAGLEPGSPSAGRRRGARAQRGGAGAGAGAGRRVARRLRRRVARGRARDLRRGPDRGRDRAGPGGRARARRGAAGEARRRGTEGRDDELRIALDAARGPSLLAAMEWRERDGVRWLEAELPGATGGVLDPARRRQRGRLRVAQPRPATPTTSPSACARTARGSRRARPRRRRRPVRPSGPRRRASLRRERRRRPNPFT